MYLSTCLESPFPLLYLIMALPTTGVPDGAIAALLANSTLLNMTYGAILVGTLFGFL